MEENRLYNNIIKCRLCDGRGINNFVDFGKVALGNNLQEYKSKSLQAEMYPLKINRCQNCGHFQLGVSVNPKKLYATNYTYLSGIGESFVNHLEKYANWVCKEFNLGSSSFVIDIGSNDGTCLSFFKKNGCKVLGIDPAKLAADVANKNNIETINDFINDKLVKNINEKYGKADFVTSHNVLAHIEDLKGAFKNIFNLLKENGEFIFEIGYFKTVLEKNYFDTTYHEHLDYHHAIPLTKYLTKIGFDIINFETNNIQGGSLRVHAKKTLKGQITSEANNFLLNEKKSVLYNECYLEDWRKNINITMSKLSKVVKEYSKENKLIVGYGVPTKATLLLRLANLNEKEISFIVEDNIHKINKFLPSSSIKIEAVEILKERKPDIIIILAWNFSTDILEKIKKSIDYPLKCIIPLPQFQEIEI